MLTVFTQLLNATSIIGSHSSRALYNPSRVISDSYNKAVKWWRSWEIIALLLREPADSRTSLSTFAKIENANRDWRGAFLAAVDGSPLAAYVGWRVDEPTFFFSSAVSSEPFDSTWIVLEGEPTLLPRYFPIFADKCCTGHFPVWRFGGRYIVNC